MNLLRGGQKAQTPTEVVISPYLLNRIKEGALRYPDVETGEALVGLVSEKVYVLDTIAPRDDVVREWGMFSQGGDVEGDIFNWLHANWEVYRIIRRRSYPKGLVYLWDLPLLHLGDWHKQPGGMVHPSGGDFRTAKSFLREHKLDFLLTPIITFAVESQTSPQENTIIIDAQLPIRIDWWGLGRKDRDFVALKPTVIPGHGLPRLPDVVWWLNQQERMDLEIEALERAGYEVMDIVQYNIDGMPPLETCFVIYKQGNPNFWIAATPHTYPALPPQWFSAPLIRPEDGHDWFEALYAAAEPIAHVASSGQALVDSIKWIEKHELGSG